MVATLGQFSPESSAMFTPVACCSVSPPVWTSLPVWKMAEWRPSAFHLTAGPPPPFLTSAPAALASTGSFCLRALPQPGPGTGTGSNRHAGPLGPLCPNHCVFQGNLCCSRGSATARKGLENQPGQVFKQECDSFGGGKWGKISTTPSTDGPPGLAARSLSWGT